MKITKNFLKKQNACEYGYIWFCDQKETELVPLLKKLMSKKIQNQIRNEYSDNSLDWANWLIVRKMKYKQYVSYSVFAAEQVIYIYEQKRPNNNAARKAIESAKKCINSPIKKNKEKAAAAAACAGFAGFTAATAAHAAHAATTAHYAVYYASAVSADEDKMKKKILKYGIKLLL